MQNRRSTASAGVEFVGSGDCLYKDSLHLLATRRARAGSLVSLQVWEVIAYHASWRVRGEARDRPTQLSHQVSRVRLQNVSFTRHEWYRSVE